MEQPPKELCTIRIIFGVSTDEQAIAVKKKVSEALKDVAGVQIHFGIVSSPNGLDIRPTANNPL